MKLFIKLIINNVIVIYPSGLSIVYSLFSGRVSVSILCITQYYNTECPYSDIGTKYGHVIYLIKIIKKI